MPAKKSETVKVSIDLKKKTLQLEGPQEFVEKYLDPILKNCEPFSKAFFTLKPLTNDAKQYINSFIELLTVLSVGFISIALLNNSLHYSYQIYVAPAGILSIISLFLGLLIIPNNIRMQRWILRNIWMSKVIRLLGWALILGPLGYNIAQSGISYSNIVGLLVSILAYIVLIKGIIAIKTSNNGIN